MGNCVSFAIHRRGHEVPRSGPSVEDYIPSLQVEIRKKLRLLMRDSYIHGFQIGSRILGRSELSRACEFVELQMLLPRRHCSDTQVLVLTAAQLACCGMLLQQPFLNNQCCFVHSLSLHVLFESQRLQLEAYGIALSTLARFLQGNTNLTKLSLNLMGVTILEQTSMSKRVFAGVMQAFALMLRSNTTLRLLRFEGMVGDGGVVPWSEEEANQVCKAQAAQSQLVRLAFCMGQHPRCEGASPLSRHLPHDLVLRILDLASPLKPPCRVEFDFCSFAFDLEDLP